MLNFARRINRVTFIVGLILDYIILILLAVIQAITEGANDNLMHKNTLVGFFLAIISLVGVVFVIIYALALTRQRSNDIGWHPLLVTVLVFWNPLAILLVVLPGKKSSNKYGSAPAAGIRLKA